MLLRRQLRQPGKTGKQGKPDGRRWSQGVGNIQFGIAARENACYLDDSDRRALENRLA